MPLVSVSEVGTDMREDIAGDDASNKNELDVEEHDDLQLETDEVLEYVVSYESDDDLDIKY